ncbi:MAG TPA: hypothetical protein VGI28_01750 [Stellaceae bacterium]|jgi:hypothetical protein
MSSRILADSAERSPGGPPEPPAPAPAETPDAQRARPEPQERGEEVAADDARESASPSPEARDAPAEASEGTTRQPSESDRDFQRRIDQLTRDKYAAQRERDEMRQQYEAWQRQQQQAAQPRVPAGQEDPYERARREVRDEAVTLSFNAACNDLFRRGQDEYGQEMGDAVQALNAVGWGNRPDALAAVTQLPDGHRVYRELARDLDNAARVLSLPPMAMALELARLSGRDEPRDPGADGRAFSETNGRERVAVTRAPEPIRPVGGNSRQSERPLDDARVSMAEFIRRRDREERRSRISR